jgi:gliding motility-associated-like protein
LECTGSNQVGFTRAASGGTLRMTLTIKAGYESGFVLNGTPMNVNDFQPVNGSNGEYVFLHRIFSNTEIPAGSGSLVTNFGAELFHMSLLYDLGPSCNYGYFSDFSYLNLGTTRSLCLGDSAVLDAGPGKTEYTWSTGDTTQKITVFDPGTYYVFVRSGNQCTAADTIEVEYYSPAVRIEASRDTICEGTQLLLTVPGSFLFKWQDNSTNPFFIASDSGIYYVEVTDYQGCRARDSIRIYTAPRPLTPIATILPFDSSVTSDSLCVGESVTLEMSTLQGATYAWIGPNNSLYTGSELSFPAINPTNSGQYLAYNIVDGCESLYDTLNLIVKPTPEVYIGETDTVCSVENLLLDAGAGSGYTYLWQDESTNQTFTANAPGLYWVEVSNPEGCSKRDSVRLVFSTRPVTPDIQIGGNSASAYSGCEGTDVTLGLSALSGGQYFWITPAPSDTIQSPGTSFPITNLDSMNQGVYYAYYKSNGCKSTLDSLTLTVNLKPPFNSPFSDTSICGTGSIVLDAGSSPDVTFRWSDNSTGSTITVTEQGTYWVEIKNSNNCVNSDTVEIGGGEIPSTPTVEGDSTLCTGDTLVLTISNAQSGATYVWNGPTGTINTATLNLPNAEAGTYEVFANLDGCYSADTASFQVSLDSIPNVDVGADTLICGGQTVILVANSSSNVTFSWSNNTTESTLSVTTPGTYWVEVRNNAGCVASDSAVVGDSGSPVTPVVEGDRDLCIGESLILSVTNTQSGVSYVWNGPSGTINSSTLNLPLPGPGTYEVFALLNGCYSFDTTSLQISINQYPDFNLGSDTVICGVNSTQLNGPDGYMTYVWSNGDTTQQTTLVAGQNTLTVTSLAGCVGSDTIILSIGNPVAAFSSSPESGALLGTPVNYTDQSLGAPILWNWSFGDNQGASNQNVSHAFQSEGTKTVTLIITDQAGCTDTTSKVIEISNSVAVPNSFTPNADGKNDFFAVKGLSAFPNSKLIIFNRWGSEIYNSSDYDNKWDGGKYPDGVYFYILELTSGETLKGDVTILRN